THVNDLFSRGLVDTLRYINGELKTEDITDGKYIDNWVEAARTMNGGLFPLMDQDERDKRFASMMGTSVAEMRQVRAMNKKPGMLTPAARNLQAQLKDNIKRIAQVKASYDAPSQNAPIYEARRKAAKGSDIEA